MTKAQMEKRRFQCGMTGRISVGRVGLGGGLLLMRTTGWENIPDGDMVEERLDRCVVNGRISADYGHILSYHLVASGPDHRPILGELLNEFPIVEEGIKNCAGKLAEWNKLTFGHVQKQLAAAHKELEVLQGRMGQDQVLLKKKVERTIVVLLEKEEVMWRQRSRVAWLKEGDKNTRVFHERANTRERKNTIKGLYDDDHFWQTDKQVIGSMFCNFSMIYFLLQVAGI
ncbi:hypothetical protein L3X38_025596 [Prunus dulcis]|uniref:Uncharacterized protein n=1 Tax=Prunus dulcis TaxID=3755 RepID=A0AAD4W253_PRUDU|nr:hypothetical protein L3X38_025596 [Prunus dulcis]